MSVNKASTIFTFASLALYVPIGCRHSLMRYWQPLLAQTKATCSLQHPDIEHRQSVNSYKSCIFCNQDIVWIFTYITLLMTALIGTNTIYQRWNTDTNQIVTAHCTTFRSSLLFAENTILIRYYEYTANTKALYEFIDGPSGRPAGNPHNSDGLGVYNRAGPQ